ncbi:hypothetical protein VTI28DRAFT_7769 [Corynascus sepedonium]
MVSSSLGGFRFRSTQSPGRMAYMLQGEDSEITNLKHTRADSLYGNFPNDRSEGFQDAGPVSMDTNFDPPDFYDGNTTDLSLLTIPGNEDGMSGLSSAADHSLSGTESAVADGTDYSTVGHEYLGDNKISHATMLECAENCYFWHLKKGTIYRCVICETEIKDSTYNFKRHLRTNYCERKWDGLDKATQFAIICQCRPMCQSPRRGPGSCQRKWELMM